MRNQRIKNLIIKKKTIAKLFGVVILSIAVLISAVQLNGTFQGVISAQEITKISEVKTYMEKETKKSINNSEIKETLKPVGDIDGHTFVETIPTDPDPTTGNITHIFKKN